MSVDDLLLFACCLCAVVIFLIVSNHPEL